MRFATKVKLYILMAALLPLLLSNAVVISNARSDLFEQAEQKLLAVRELKSRQINELFRNFTDNFTVVAKVVSQDFAPNQPLALDNLLTELSQASHFYDIFVINPQGDVVYTVAKEADFGSNLLHGQYANSNLGELTRRTFVERQLTFADFAPYAPSNGDPAAFLAQPVTIQGQQWLVAVQLSIEKINAIMQIREGMGDTGESYLVGSDFRMRSDSYLDPTKHSVIASFRGDISQNGVQTATVREALGNRKGLSYIDDYNGNPVVSAYAPVTLFGVTWALLSEVDVAEIAAPAQHMVNLALLVLLVASIGAAAIATAICRFVLQPLGGEPQDMCALTKEIASGVLTRNLQHSNQFSLMGWLAKMQHDLKQMIARLIGMGQQLEMAAAQNSAAITQADSSLQLQAKETEMLASAVEEMSYAAAEIGQNTTKAASEVDSCQQSGQQLEAGIHHVVSSLTATLTTFRDIRNQALSLDADSKKIATIVDVITAIAEQTNLLALNAAIEAARAGEQGRGFAVVADEVRQLAGKVQLATQDISEVISGLLNKANTLSTSTASCEQSANATQAETQGMQQQVDDISARLLALKLLMAQTATAAEEQTSVSATLARGIASLSAAAEENSTAISEVAHSTRNLLDLATELGVTTGHFKV